MAPRDTEEWQRPWRAEDDARIAVTPAPPTGDPVASPAPDDDPDEPAAGPQEPTRASAFAAPGTVATPSHVTPPASAPEGPATSWAEQDHGPGSPAGSVRPPDTIGTSTAPEPEKRGSTLGIGLVAGLIGALMGTGGMYAALDSQGRLDPEAVEQPAAIAAPVPRETVTADAGDIPVGNEGNVVPGVARTVLPSVVRIDILAGGSDPVGLGSGVVYRSDGYIITNNHVVAEATSLEVKLASGASVEAELVGTDPLNDLAVLKIDQTGMTPIELRPDGLETVVGETAIALGSPFGLDASVTAGVVSAINRDITVPSDDGNPIIVPAVLQTDAAINPGNSGGALVDSAGRLIGINTAILSANGGSQGVGFAIPVEQAIISADQLIATGEVRTGFLGVRGEPVTPEIADAFGLDQAGGAIIGDVEADSAAEDAGLEVEDIIIAVNGDPIDSFSDLVVIIRRTMPGEVVGLTLLRDGEEIDVEVTLGDRPEVG